MRYDQLLKFVREKQPKAILEVGTWNGERAKSDRPLFDSPGIE